MKVKNTRIIIYSLTFFFLINILTFCQKESRTINPEREALKLDWKLKGKTFFNQKNYKEAYKSFTNYLNLSLEDKSSKDIASAYINLGLIYSKFNKYQEAEDSYQKALEQSESDDYLYGKGESYHYRGENWAKQKNYDQALKNYEKAVDSFKDLLESDNQEDKNSAQFGLGISDCSIGLIYKEKKDFDKAIEHYQEAIHYQEELVKLKILEPNLTKTDLKEDDIVNIDALSITYNNLGMTFIELKKYSDAVTYYEKAIKLGKLTQNQEILAIFYNNLGEALTRTAYKISDIDRALEAYKTALTFQKKEDPSYQKINNNLNQLYELKEKLIKEEAVLGK